MATESSHRAGPRNALLQQLMDAYPVMREAKPLAIGIHKTLMALQPELDKAALRKAMLIHTQSTRYLKGIVEGAPRFDLAGNPEGVVTAAQQQQAVATLKERMKRQAERRKAEEEARQRQEKLLQLAEKFNSR